MAAVFDVAQWRLRDRDYARDQAEVVLGRERIGEGDHPLASRKHPTTTVAKQPAASKEIVEDPLSMLLTTDQPGEEKKQPPSPPPEPLEVVPTTKWTLKKQSLVREFSTSAATQRATVALIQEAEASRKQQKGRTQGRDDDVPELLTTKAPKLVERSAARLQHLERGGGDEGLGSSGEAELLEKLSRAQTSLSRHWANEERVAALKAAISVAKVLREGAMSFTAYYPSLYVAATEVLEAFGAMVYGRIQAKEKLDPNEAKETCRNWFYKTACIRELIPRFFVETSLLSSYEFLTDKDYPQILARLASIVRGIGSPLCAFYARAYLAHHAAKFSTKMAGKYGVLMARDMLYSFQDVKKPKFLASCGMPLAAVVKTLDPAVERTLSRLDPDDPAQFAQVLAQYRDFCNDATVLQRILEAFSPSLAAAKAAAVVALAKRAEPSKTSTVAILGTVGAIFTKDPPQKSQRLPLLNDVWKVVTRCNDLADYVSCASRWLDCLLKHYTDREVSLLLGDVIEHVKAAEASTPELEDLVQMLVQSCTMIANEHVLSLLDVFRPHRKVQIAKEFLRARAQSSEMISDPVLIHAVLEIGRVAHDALDSLSPQGDRRHVAGLVAALIDKVDMGRDLERQLAVYVECRAAFHNLDAVLDRLVLKAAGLAVVSKKFASRAQSRSKDKAATSRLAERAQNFSKACLAYAHVTIPSIDRLFRRLDLLVLCGHCALLNNCLPHADTFFKASIALIPELPQQSRIDYDQDNFVPGDKALADFLQRLAGSLVAVPGHPEHGPFYLVTGLLNALPRYQHWGQHAKIQAYVALLPLLSALAQRRLPYTVVEANDVLYGGSPDYLAELKAHLATLVATILDDLANTDDSLARAPLILDLVNAIAYVANLGGDAARLAKKLFTLASKHKSIAPPPLLHYFDATHSKLAASHKNDA